MPKVSSEGINNPDYTGWTGKPSKPIEKFPHLCSPLWIKSQPQVTDEDSEITPYGLENLNLSLVLKIIFN
ncbi:hypothetical protein AC812_07120 [Bellilinea caldifistulae]|uniref:Uncharacterized protein n=1 Tax=Bellilinea caldifistulae TaxID=360411 RepID=A0A0P6X4E5_9CHLR|nr:hypothetical protein AC812_07120 [Bellilinea caldifistulae]